MSGNNTKKAGYGKGYLMYTVFRRLARRPPEPIR